MSNMPPIKAQDAIYGRAGRKSRLPGEGETCRVWPVPGKSPETQWAISMKQEAAERKPLGTLVLKAGVHARC
jgi:hypothetical protein